VIALDDNGDKRWERTHGTDGEEDAVSIAQSADSRFGVAGYTQRPGLKSFDNWVIRLDASGAML
jgi:hypothetical protein